jgi:hypothetical protein
MATTLMQMRVAAKRLFEAGDERLANYIDMPQAELEALLTEIEGGKPQAQPVSRPRRAGSKGTAKSAPAKKSSAPRGSKGEAKRPAAAAKRPPSEQPLAANGRQGRMSSEPRGGELKGYRAPVRYEDIDWTQPWNGGQSGTRALVMTKLRETNGDVEKTWKALRKKAHSMYNLRPGTDYERHLRWHIHRTAYDYALATGQHESGTRRLKASEQKAPRTRSVKPRVAKSVEPSLPKGATRARTPAGERPRRRPESRPAARQRPVSRTAGGLLIKGVKGA